MAEIPNLIGDLASYLLKEGMSSDMVHIISFKYMLKNGQRSRRNSGIQ